MNDPAQSKAVMPERQVFLKKQSEMDAEGRTRYTMVSRKNRDVQVCKPPATMSTPDSTEKAHLSWRSC